MAKQLENHHICLWAQVRHLGSHSLNFQLFDFIYSVHFVFNPPETYSSSTFNFVIIFILIICRDSFFFSLILSFQWQCNEVLFEFSFYFLFKSILCINLYLRRGANVSFRAIIRDSLISNFAASLNRFLVHLCRHASVEENCHNKL